jgi:hypothetical protein
MAREDLVRQSSCSSPHSRRLIAAGAAALLAASAAASVASAATPVATFSLPAPSSIAFGTSAIYGSDGLLYAYDGKNVFKQGAVNGSSFAKISTADAAVTGSDAGPVTFTQNGSTIVVGTGSGGTDFSSAGKFLTLPAAGGTFTPLSAVIPGQFAFTPLPASSTVVGAGNKLAMNQGDFASSSVSYFDITSGSNVSVISSIPGASSELAFGPGGNLYVGVGFDGDNDGAGPDTDHRGEIRSFTIGALDGAFNSATPIPFSSGTLLNAASNNGGNGFFVSQAGYLFAGAGSEGGLITISPTGDVTSYNLGLSFPALRYNPTNDQFAAIAFDGATSVFNASSFVPEPGIATSFVLAFGAGSLLRRGRRAA